MFPSLIVSSEFIFFGEGLAQLSQTYNVTKTRILWPIQMVMNIIYMEKQFRDDES